MAVEKFVNYHAPQEIIASIYIPLFEVFPYYNQSAEDVAQQMTLADRARKLQLTTDEVAHLPTSHIFDAHGWEARIGYAMYTMLSSEETIIATMRDEKLTHVKQRVVCFEIPRPSLRQQIATNWHPQRAQLPDGETFFLARLLENAIVVILDENNIVLRVPMMNSVGYVYGTLDISIDHQQLANLREVYKTSKDPQ